MDKNSCRFWLSSVKKDAFQAYTILKEGPILLAYSSILFAVLASLGIFVCIYMSEQAVFQAKNIASFNYGASVANEITSLLISCESGVNALTAHIVATKSCHELQSTFVNFSTSILSFYPNINRVELDIYDIVAVNGSYVYPSFPNESLLIGCNLLTPNQTCYPIDREKELIQIRKKRTFFSGPFDVDGIFGIFALHPLWLPSATFDTDLMDCGVSNPDCEESFCWDGENRMKYFGMAGSLIKLDSLKDGTFNGYHILNGYSYRLRVQDLSLEDYNSDMGGLIIYSNGELNSDPVVVEITYDNIKWQLELSPESGWVPAWETPCIIFVVVSTLIFSLGHLRILCLKEKHSSVLKSMLPENAIKHLQTETSLFAEQFEFVTILFADIVDYTLLASMITPIQVVSLLDELYITFDMLAKKHGVYKVETIGDSYMCSTGCPVAEDAHIAAKRMINFAKDLLLSVKNFHPNFLPAGFKVEVRVGVHSGPCVAGIIGKVMPRYCLFGDTVNTAARMESNGEPMRIHMSQLTGSTSNSNSIEALTLI